MKGIEKFKDCKNIFLDISKNNNFADGYVFLCCTVTHQPTTTTVEGAVGNVYGRWWWCQ